MSDGTASLDELDAITAFAHLLAHWFEENGKEFFETHDFIPERWILRENKWRAIRSGVRADLINHETLEVESFNSVMLHWIEKLKPYSVKLGYTKYLRRIVQILNFGNSSDRQRAILNPESDHRESGITAKSIQLILKSNVQEMETD
jgi:carboxylate-amine ligase